MVIVVKRVRQGVINRINRRVIFTSFNIIYTNSDMDGIQTIRGLFTFLCALPEIDRLHLFLNQLPVPKLCQGQNNCLFGAEGYRWHELICEAHLESLHEI